jgi:Fur family transcriptional regulator, zinc uptake regulator
MKIVQARFAESCGKRDHQQCVIRAMRAAEKLCEQEQLQLTPIRRRVLELILQRHAPIGAYDILGAMKKGEGALAPPTVYRALEFLLEAGLIHRIDALNAFVACESPDRAHTGQFFICSKCQRVTELKDDAIAQAAGKKARTVGFATTMNSIEIKGTCEACKNQERSM